MKRLLLVLLLAACSSSDPSKPVVGIPTDCEHVREKPTAVTLACADGSVRLEGIRYDHWSSSRATGTATVLANDFTPDRAHGTERPYPALVVFEAPERGQFTRVQVRYVDAHPYADPVETYELGPSTP